MEWSEEKEREEWGGEERSEVNGKKGNDGGERRERGD